VADATPQLLGVLWTSTTLTAAGSPYNVSGDLTVAPGVTLTIEPGVTVNFDTVDRGRGCWGGDNARVELVVKGSLVAVGTKALPIRLSSLGTTAGSWGDVELTASSTARLDYVTVEKAVYGVVYRSTAATNTIRRSTFQCNTTGLLIDGGTATMDAIVSTDNQNDGIAVADQGRLNLTNSVLASNGNAGLWVDYGNPALTHNLTNCTVYANGTVYGNASAGIFSGQAGGTINVKNSIVTNHSGYGILLGGTTHTINVAYSDVWNNGTNLVDVTVGAGMISQDPGFVGGAVADLHLRSGSVCIDTGTATGAPATDLDGVARPINGDRINGAEFDMGAYEFDPSRGSTGAGGTSGGASGAGGAACASGMSGAGGTSAAGGTSGASGAAGAGGASGTSGASGSGGSGGAGGTNGASGSGGGGAGGAAPTTDAGTDASVPPKGGGSGCGCSASEGGSGASPVVLTTLGVALLVIARRRRRPA
jgi:MYXO-CTERM domain-containing protein